MRNVYDRGAAPRSLPDTLEQTTDIFRGQVLGRLIENQDLGFGGQCLGDFDDKAMFGIERGDEIGRSK